MMSDIEWRSYKNWSAASDFDVQGKRRNTLTLPGRNFERFGDPRSTTIGSTISGIDEVDSIVESRGARPHQSRGMTRPVRTSGYSPIVTQLMVYAFELCLDGFQAVAP
jgi:hypothetical protein